MGLIQTLISDYERDRTRPQPEMLVIYSLALEVSSKDDLLGLTSRSLIYKGNKADLKTLRRLKKIKVTSSFPAESPFKNN
jgi:hypothetical protein